jgi:hypothetical protein
MNEIESNLWALVREVEPTASQKAGAQRSHNYLRALLDTGQMAARIQNSYLSGSYARDTAIRPLDDVDIIFEIDPAAWQTRLLNFGFLPSPARVLESFANAIRYRYPVSSVHGQRRSIRLELEHLDIDVVPAVPIGADASGLIWIPDRDSDEWIKSSPKRHSALAAEVNRTQEGRFKPLVKLLKYWNSNLPDTIRTKSFAIETMAVRLFRGVRMNSLEQGALMYWDFLAHFAFQSSLFKWTQDYGIALGMFSVSVPDAAETGSNTVARMTSAQKSAFVEKARISRDRLLAAKTARFARTMIDHVYDAFRA